jgi:hypothetical protein
MSSDNRTALISYLNVPPDREFCRSAKRSAAVAAVRIAKL